MRWNDREMPIQRPRHCSEAPYLRIAEAISTTPCEGATVIPSGGAAPPTLRCQSFEADLVQPVTVDEETEDLVPTGETVKVWHKFQTPMVVGASITLALRPDGRWTLLVWECEE
jgi:hypothetical protein